MSLLTTASLVITPNAGKEGTLFSVVPNTSLGDMSVVRATTATRVNSAGLVELVPYNLLQYSEQFDNAAWSKTAISVSANSATAPNGLNTADTLSNTSASAIILQTSPSVNTSAVVTFSAYLKRTNNDWVVVAIARNGATTYGELYVWFNIATGAVGSNLPDGAAVLVDADIEDAGNGWYRCSVTGYVPNAVSYVAFMFLPDANSSFNRVTSQSVYAWGSQLVEGTLPKDYQKTETRLNIPRLDYSNGTCPSLLVEPQRTNVQPYSEDLSQVGIENGSVTTNVITSPSGIQNADLYTENTTTSYHRLNNGVLTYVSGQSYTFSVYAKANGTGRYLIINASSAFNALSFFDLNSGTIALIDSGTASIEDMGNGWYRCSVTNSRIYGTGSDSMYFGLSTGLTDSAYTGNGTTGFYAWGMQIEAGSYQTSYIPTTSASVTRNADVISKTGISSLIGQTEGTVFVDVDVNLSYTQADMRFINVSDGTSANWYFIGTNVENEFRFYYRAGATTYVTITTALTSGRHKLAFAYKSNDYVAYLDGTQVNNTTTLAVGSTSQIELGNSFGGNIGKEYINASALWKTRLTNTQLATLTTL